jgi:hypothetical protein
VTAESGKSGAGVTTAPLNRSSVVLATADCSQTTIRDPHRPSRLGINIARHVGLNTRVQLIVNRAYGFHSASAAIALIMVALGPIELLLLHQRSMVPDP